MNKQSNLDSATVSSFGDEWTRFDQSELPLQESKKLFDDYFSVFPWDSVPSDAEGFDMGCGTGRWARWVSQKVGKLHCIDPSHAINIARRNLADATNIDFHCASLDDEVLPPASQDFGYSLGVLHHVPDTELAIRKCVELLKPGAPLLLYLYYSFDNRGYMFILIWRISNWLRLAISRMPDKSKSVITDLIAIIVYLPMAWASKLLELLKFDVSRIPLSFYRHHSFYTMRTDARDRFGTPLEQRFTRHEILNMMERSGLSNIRFSEDAPYWCACGVKQDPGEQNLKM